MMRNPLHKTLKKEFKQNIARYLSIMIILVVMISAVSGFLTVAYGYKDALKENQTSSHVEDGQFIVTNKMNQKTIDEIQKSLYKSMRISIVNKTSRKTQRSVYLKIVTMSIKPLFILGVYQKMIKK